jgi:hypothetical protein
MLEPNHREICNAALAAGAVETLPRRYDKRMIGLTRELVMRQVSSQTSLLAF